MEEYRLKDNKSFYYGICYTAVVGMGLTKVAHQAFDYDLTGVFLSMSLTTLIALCAVINFKDAFEKVEPNALEQKLGE